NINHILNQFKLIQNDSFRFEFYSIANNNNIDAFYKWLFIKYGDCETSSWIDRCDTRWIKYHKKFQYPLIRLCSYHHIELQKEYKG
ncbi:MAG: hypothetical protein ABIJ08_07460, partial [Nanoarchaeota archaeon]